MTDYIGPFGPESIEAAQRVILSWAHSGDPADVGSARPVLAAAVSALDREELTGRAAMAIAEANGYTANIYPAAPPYKMAAREAAAVIAAIFPTEGEAER